MQEGNLFYITSISLSPFVLDKLNGNNVEVSNVYLIVYVILHTPYQTLSIHTLLCIRTSLEKREPQTLHCD